MFSKTSFFMSLAFSDPRPDASHSVMISVMIISMPVKRVAGHPRRRAGSIREKIENI
jgi:hypothetical protein